VKCLTTQTTRKSIQSLQLLKMQVHPQAAQALLFGSAPCCIYGCTPAPWPTMSEDKQNFLLYLYCQRVDCLYKILHWPTALPDIARLQSEAHDIYKPTPIKALEMSIYFTSLCSITNEEARNLGLGDRAGLIKQYREATEKAISEGGLLQRPNVIVLQAFVIYLVRSSHLAPFHDVDIQLTSKPKVGYRTFYNSATWWALLAVAVRAGTALRFGQEDQEDVNSMELELRRRLWYRIALMDTHGSYDRSTLPVLHWDDLGPAPLLLNDD
jgi:hypothetical protein